MFADANIYVQQPFPFAHGDKSESGTITYGYDPNGNLTRKTDARSIQTNYLYDALNRVTQRSYTDSTPLVNYIYDNLTNAKGKLTKVSSTVSTTEYTGFDILGRVTGHKQTTDGTQYTTGYTYNLGGALLEETYPSGRVVKNTLDTTGDLQQVQSHKSGDTLRNYANGFTYNAAGAVSAMRLGNGKWESIQFNSRLQPTQIALGGSAGNANLLKLDYTYGTTANNGNVLTQDITVTRSGQSPLVFNQTYTYDELNRIKIAEEKTGTTSNWKQTFTFDRYGNRRFDFTGGNTTVPASGCSEPVCNPTVSTTNNRLTSTGWLYDNAGNTTRDGNYQTFTYDAENKQTSVSGTGGTIGQYYYDGDGKRVKKYVPSTGETTIFVYDAAGKLVAEYSTIVATAQDAKVAYMTSDHLGSPRINTDANGTVIARHDYHPFGEEISTSQRTTTLKYAADTIRKQFTGYERDGETGIDFAEARMYFFSLGRFGNPDPQNLWATESDPQSWNGYSYVLNNPLVLTDPSGLIWLREFGTEAYTWVDDDIYNANLKKDKDYYKGFIPSNYAVINFGSGTGQYAGAAQRGQRVMLGADGGVHPITDDAWERGTVHFGTDDPLQQLFNGHEEVMQHWRTPIYVIGTAEMAALSIATAAGAGAGGGGLTTIGTQGLSNSTALQAAIGRALMNPNMMNKIFSARHLKEFGPLFLRYGSKSGIVSAVINGLSNQSLQQGVNTCFVRLGEITVKVNVFVEGGVIKVNDFWVVK